VDLESAATKGRAFLVVDDNQGFLELIESFILRNYPDSFVGAASGGAEALSKLEERGWDVVLLDYLLPDFDGVEVLGEIRKRKKDVAVIVVTGEGDERLAADLFRMGAYDYLVKSTIDPVTLRRTLDQVLMRRTLEEQIRDRSDALAESSRELSERGRALDTAYENIRQKKEELRFLSNSLETTVGERTAELRATTSFLNTVLDSASRHFIIASGEDGVVLSFNRGAELAFGRTAEDVISNQYFGDLFEVLPGEDGIENLLERCRAEGSLELELQGCRPNGRFVARVALSPLRGAGVSGSSGLVLVGLDITHERELEKKNQAYIRQIEMANLDLRRKNDQILEANQLKTAFLANMSHELRTPLNAIIGYADLLDQGIYGDLAPRQQPAVEGISTRAQDLLRLINDILDLAKIESGRVDLLLENIPLEGLMDEVVETAQVLAIDKPIVISWNRPAAGIVLRTDRQKLQQILLNLVNNAVKFTFEGHVVLDTELASGGDIVFAVRDSGIGIPDSEVGQIFDEFRQVDGTSTRQFGGTGLGLAISHKFAGHLGGELSADSELGVGSVFTLRIPVRLGDDALGSGASHTPIALDSTLS
jgi:signal transduction histidine kinase